MKITNTKERLNFRSTENFYELTVEYNKLYDILQYKGHLQFSEPSLVTGVEENLLCRFNIIHNCGNYYEQEIYAGQLYMELPLNTWIEQEETTSFFGLIKGNISETLCWYDDEMLKVKIQFMNYVIGKLWEMEQQKKEIDQKLISKKEEAEKQIELAMQGIAKKLGFTMAEFTVLLNIIKNN